MPRKKKSSVYDTMFLTLFETEKKYINLIVPLANIHYIGHNKKTKLVIDLEREKFKINPGKYYMCSVGVTDDPFCEWAGDWGNLGTFRLAIYSRKCEVTKDKKITVICDTNEFKRDINMADRVV